MRQTPFPLGKGLGVKVIGFTKIVLPVLSSILLAESLDHLP